jgi:hypothetical protein
MDKDKQESVSLGSVDRSQQSLDPSNLLAWYIYPEPHGKIYTSEDLESLAIVEELFDYCQILLASISQSGWQFLVETHGIEGLIAVNKISGWFSQNTPQDTIDCLRYHSLISGYDTVTRLRGNYDDKTGVFSPDHEGKYHPIWGSWDD